MALGQQATPPDTPEPPIAAENGAASIAPVDVIGSTPLLGSGVDRDKVPAKTDVLTDEDVNRPGFPSALRALNQTVGGVSLDEAQGNPFQPNLMYRGFEASPLVGDQQGLAVYLNGARFNQPFGDTVNWDLIPDVAIDRIDLVGSNPAFGLNALGGALSVQLKNGFLYRGADFEALGGSFGRVQGSFQYGQEHGPTAIYIAGSGLHENGWREHSPSALGQFYSDVGWRGDRAEAHLNLSAADNDLTGNGGAPVELLAARRRAAFTYPDETRNRWLRVVLSGSYDLSSATSLQGSAYYGRFVQRTRNGDAAEAQPCEDDPALVCTEDGDPYSDRSGNPIPNFVTGSPYAAFFPEFAEGGPYAFENRTATDTDSYGVSLQATNAGAVLNRSNQLAAGLGFDGGATDFRAESLLGALTLKRGFAGPGVVVDQADASISPVRVSVDNRYYGLFLTDTLDVTPKLSTTVSGRFNAAQLELHDKLGTALNGDHTYMRFNPGAGATYRVLPNLSAYFGYAEANRAPTPAELSCASPDSPCSLTNFFVGDPDLKQVVGHTFEGGFRGAFPKLRGASLDWHAGVFRTDSDDDILLVASPTIGRAFFRNIGQTRRQGVEAGVRLTSGPLSAFVQYAYTDATFERDLLLNSPENPEADANGQIRVRPGDRLPGIPRHVVKFGASYRLATAWVVGFDGRAASGQYLFGDEANLTPKTDPYVVVNLMTRYQVTKNLEIFGLVENAFDARHETFGTFSPTGEVPILEARGASNPRSLSPGAPIAGYGGIRLSF